MSKQRIIWVVRALLIASGLLWLGYQWLCAPISVQTHHYQQLAKAQAHQREQWLAFIHRHDKDLVQNEPPVKTQCKRPKWPKHLEKANLRVSNMANLGLRSRFNANWRVWEWHLKGQYQMLTAYLRGWLTHQNHCLLVSYWRLGQADDDPKTLELAVYLWVRQ